MHRPAIQPSAPQKRRSETKAAGWTQSATSDGCYPGETAQDAGLGQLRIPHLRHPNRTPRTGAVPMVGAHPSKASPMQTRPVRVTLYVDHKLLLTALAQSLSKRTGLEPAHTVHDQAAHLADWQAAPDADVIVLAFLTNDHRLFMAVQAFRARHPHARLLLVANSTSPAIASAAIAAGIQGYLLPTASVDQLHQAIRCVADGHPYIDSALAQEIAFQHRPAHERLSPRERELLRYLAEGWRSRDVARHLNLSEKTVSTFRARLKQKLGVQTPRDLMAYVRSNPVL